MDTLQKNYTKIDAEKGAKSMPKGFQNDVKMDAESIVFGSKVHGKSDAKIDVEKVMNNHEKSMRKWYGI